MAQQRELYRITIRRPMAQALIHGPARIVCKSWVPDSVITGKWIAIHAGRLYDEKVAKAISEKSDLLGWYPPQDELCQKGIIGVARVLRIVDRSNDPWWTIRFGPYGIVFAEAVAFSDPIPRTDHKGAQGVFPVEGRLREEIRQAYRAAIAARRLKSEATN